MFSNQSAEASLDAPCRALAAVRSDKVESRFVAGSCSVRQPNHLFVMRFHGEVNELGVDATIPHETGPVSRIECSPTEGSVVATTAEQSDSATIWKLPRSVVEQADGLQFDPEDDHSLGIASTASMEKLTSLTPAGGTEIVDMAWRDSSDDGMPNGADLLTLDRKGKLCRWDVADGAAQTDNVVDTSIGKPASFPPRVAWDPHGNGDAVAVSRGTSIGILDWRADTSVPTGTVESFQAHRYAVTDLDYNPNKPYVLATCGQDGLLKFWDLRAANHPLLVARGGHSHWAWSVKYNPFHDQLVLSSGTDSLVNLWRVSSISSAPLLTLDDNADATSSDTSAPNVRVARYEHGDSVYSTAWGAADAWVYMTLGYDGKVVLSHVPSKEKYKILL